MNILEHAFRGHGQRWGYKGKGGLANLDIKEIADFHSVCRAMQVQKMDSVYAKDLSLLLPFRCSTTVDGKDGGDPVTAQVSYLFTYLLSQ
jgi:hypothetical protein